MAPKLLTTQKKSYIALILGVIIIGASPVMIKAAEAPGVVTSFYRMSIGAVFLILPFWLSIRRKHYRVSKKGILLAVLAGCCFGIDMAIWSTGIVGSNATIPTLSANIAPVWAGLGAILFLKEKIHKGFWTGLMIALIGMVVLLLKDFNADNGVLKGFLHGLFAGMFYGIYYLFTQSGRKKLSTIDFLFISTLTSSVMLFFTMIILGYSFVGYSNNTGVLFIVYGISVQVIAWWLINYSQGNLKAVVVSPSLLGQPVITALIAFYALGEVHTILQLLGGCVVIIGIYFVHYTRLKKT